MKTHKRSERIGVDEESPKRSYKRKAKVKESSSSGVPLPKKAIGWLIFNYILTFTIEYPIRWLTGYNVLTLGDWFGEMTTPNLGWMVYLFFIGIVGIGCFISWCSILLYGFELLEEWLAKQDSYSAD